MGKYHSMVRKRTSRMPQGPHPIWQTLGCLMMVIVPIMAIAGAVITLQHGLDARWPIPAVMLRPISFPDFFYRVPVLAWLALQIGSVNYLVGYAVISLVYILVLGGLVAILYAVLYRMAGPPRYGPLDAPPIPRRAKPFRR